MRTLTIEIDGEHGLDVVNGDGQRANGLTIGEVLEQVLAEIGRVPKAYPMHTPAEWEAISQAARQRRALREATQDDGA